MHGSASPHEFPYSYKFSHMCAHTYMCRCTQPPNVLQLIYLFHLFSNKQSMLQKTPFLVVVGHRAFHHYRDKDKPLKLHVELERLLREEYRNLDDFRAKEKAEKAATKECVASSSGNKISCDAVLPPTDNCGTRTLSSLHIEQSR